MEMEDEDSRIDLSSVAVDDDDHADEISTEDCSEDDEYETSTDEEEDEYETSTYKEEEDAGPPIHFAEDLSSPPEWILLDVQGYIDARKNATTASACRSKGRGAIRVTFWAALPPRVSCFTVHCDGMKPYEFYRDPMIVAAEDDLVLLRVVTGRGTKYITEYFVYQAAGATSTLRLLDAPLAFPYHKAGILRLRDGEFLVAAIQLVVGTTDLFDLHLFDSRTWAWTTRLMRVDRPERFCMQTTKVLCIGGERGSMAWVDLWKGMLVCDLLADDAMLRYIPLPLPPSSSTDPEQCPLGVRDIAVVQGRIKFFEMHFKVRRRAITSTTALVTKTCKATTWEKADPWQRWRKDCGLDILKVPVDKVHPELPSHLHDMGKLHGCQSALSLHEEDVVYIMAKPETNPDLRLHHKDVGYGKIKDGMMWMLALDVRKKTLREVAAFDVGRLYRDSFISFRVGCVTV
jgi:hypothetical protein